MKTKRFFWLVSLSLLILLLLVGQGFAQKRTGTIRGTVKDEAAAKEFMIDHKGKNILKFNGINPDIIKTLD